MISPPRALVTFLAALFSLYHLVLATYTLAVPGSAGTIPRDSAPVIVAMVLYVLVTALSLWPRSPLVMPLWMAALNVAASVVMSILVLSQLDGAADNNGYSTWFVAAVGTLMTITAVRRQAVFAWLGVGAIAVSVTVWSSPASIITTGVLGDAVWVGVAHALSHALVQAARDTRSFGRAELDAVAWRATQEAQLNEGRHRLDYMNRVAGPMLHHIVDSGSRLSFDERRESLHLEEAIRDEIRGRHLLSEEVRIEVLAARRRGIDVSLLDDGGLDDLTVASRERIQAQLADEIARSQADRLIVRTGTDTSTAAVTVVGLRVADDGSAAALGVESDDEDEVSQFVEIGHDEQGTAGHLPRDTQP